ncbi:hypothetical protein BGV07_12785, partial [Clostridioides difficile]|uniref:3-methyl-2-oxobutanoate hydroxymethyltransferase n=1 Tax=Clostridioides difficile TaxID=1496 RepID=UPI000BDC77AD
DYSIAKIMVECDINGILIGDSLGMVIKGEENTLSVTIDEIIYLSFIHISETKRVRRISYDVF